MADGTYDGPVVFVDGVHYPAGDDGGVVLDRPLRWVEGTTYRDAEADEPFHNEVHHQGHVVLEFEGVDAEPLQVTAEEYAALQARLSELRGGA